MTDIADRAQELERRNTEDALNAFRLRVASQLPAVECRGCGEEIDAARRTAQPRANRCVECEEKRERQRKMFYRRAGAR